MNSKNLLRSASIINRGSNRFFDQSLDAYGIGCGQQFFLAQIACHEGTSLYDLAQLGKYDKATTTRAVQKLTELGYITCEMDEQDRRVRRLHTTPAAIPLLDTLRKLCDEWETALYQGLTTEEIQLARQVMDKIAANAILYLKEGETKHE